MTPAEECAAKKLDGSGLEITPRKPLDLLRAEALLGHDVALLWQAGRVYRVEIDATVIDGERVYVPLSIRRERPGP